MCTILSLLNIRERTVRQDCALRICALWNIEPNLYVLRIQNCCLSLHIGVHSHSKILAYDCSLNILMYPINSFESFVRFVTLVSESKVRIVPLRH